MSEVRVSTLPQVELNRLDRVIGYFSPKAQAKRLHARAQVSAAMSYIGADTSRAQTRKWRPGLGSADADTLFDLPELRARSRDSARNHPIGVAALNAALTETVGVGFVVKAAVDREYLDLTEEEEDAWEKKAERIFRLWMKQADIHRRKNFPALHRTQLRSKLESGDILVVRRMRKFPGDLLATKIQLVEADRVSNENHHPDSAKLVAGVEFDAQGAVIAHHVSRHHPGDIHGIGRSHPPQWTRVPAYGRSGERLSWLTFNQEREGQTRGVPWLAPILEPLKQITDFGTAELHASVVNSLLVVVSKPGVPEGGGLAVGEGKKDEDRLEYELGSGLWLEGNAGDEFEVVNPSRPNTSFEAFVLAWTRQIGASLGVPFEVLQKHFSASFSASQAAMLQAWRFFRTWQQQEVDEFCQPIYELVIAEAVSVGLLDAPGFFDDPMARHAWLGTRWIGPTRGLIRPDVEVRAEKEARDAGFTTEEDAVARLYGTDWERLQVQKRRERRERERHETATAGSVPDPQQEREP